MVNILQAGTQLPSLLEGDETMPDFDNSSSDTAVQALSQVVSSVDLGSGRTPTLILHIAAPGA